MHSISEKENLSPSDWSSRRITYFHQSSSNTSPNRTAALMTRALVGRAQLVNLTSWLIGLNLNREGRRALLDAFVTLFVVADTGRSNGT